MMVGFGGPMVVCPRSEKCWEWARVYMNYCICDAKDLASFSLGMLSVLSWSVAEVPQIITNYKTKTTEGISAAFLLTWVLGDLFNLFGCLLEPATLPTQFYMAVLYTATTLILTFQTVYYDHVYSRLGTLSLAKISRKEQIDSVLNNKKSGDKDEDLAVQNEKRHISTPIPVAASVAGYGSLGRDRYYVSARSLACSPTPTAGSYSAYQRGYGKRAPASSLDEAPEEEPLLSNFSQSAPLLDTKTVMCMASVTTFFIFSFALQKSASDISYTSLDHHAGTIIPIHRKLLQNMVLKSSGNNGSSSLGSYLGWAMAMIYMSGRLPQICLNMKRGTVEGLNPLMFLFALVGNSTYVSSILVNSTKWSKIKPNLPWLVDAAACVVLDAFIIGQFIYYSRLRTKECRNNQRYLKVCAS
ncbi:uncharacterized protein LOC116259906 isoform X2 [Nymphaea colorata]|uniref:uncharacterized protein LOC116259906 isoform X2 n=1 Tax=Nymphaea colorata TaxID=210225 RepID=UPI00129D840B|nr:uncharacterized protein LOC116259906 isoform X2 [Nymphaea colorata]